MISKFVAIIALVATAPDPLQVTMVGGETDEESDEIVSVPTSNETTHPRWCTLVKPEQSGKTQVMIRRILHEFTVPPSGKTPINFIFCANSLLLTKQTKKRVNKVEELGQCVEFSSQKKVAFTSSLEIMSMISHYNVTNIVCPSNSCRVGKRAVSKNIDDCDGVIGIIDKLIKSEPNKYTFTIWMDEADKFTKALVKLHDLYKRHINVSVWCITATSAKLFEKFGNQNIFKLQNTTSSNYHGWNDNHIRHCKKTYIHRLAQCKKRFTI